MLGGGADAGWGAAAASVAGSAASARWFRPTSRRRLRTRPATTLKPFDPRKQSRHGRIDLRGRGLSQHELELDPGLGAVGGGLERGGDQIEQADGVGPAQLRRLGLKALVSLRVQAQLGRDLAQDLDHQQLAGVTL